MRTASLTAALAVAAAALAGGVEAAQVDYFLKIPGVEGEADKRGHENWIELVHYDLDRESGEVRFGDGVTGRRPPTGAADGDPDQPVIVGSLPNPKSAQQAQSDLAFVMRRASRAGPKLMQLCANGQHIPKAEIHELHDGVLAVKRTYYDLRFVSFETDGERIEPGAAGRRLARRLQSQRLANNPRVRMRYACMEWADVRSGKTSAPCPVAAKKDGTITIKGKDITLKGKKIREN